MTVKQKAFEARALLADTAFQNVMEEIRSDAVGVFLDATCDIDRIARAHERVRSVQIILDALQARIDAEAIKDKQEGQHRGND